MTDSANEVLKSGVSLKQEIKCMIFIDFHRILYTVRISVSTQDFHSCKSGSILLPSTKIK